MDEADSRFADLQRRLREPRARTRAIVALPSIDLGPRYAARTDLASFETRWLYWLFALRDPDTRVAVVTSDVVPDWEIDYYLGLIPDAPAPRERLTTIALGDLENRPLAGKLLARPDELERIAAFAAGADAAWFAPFNVTRDDRDVALATGVPILGVDQSFAQYGTKSGGRALFEEESVPAPAGARDLRDDEALRAAAAALGTKRVVVKLDEGVTGDGNAIVPGHDPISHLPAAVRAEIGSGAVVEELVAGAEFSSPSAQVRIHPDGSPEVIATHDQLLGGKDGQTYEAARFPAVRAAAPAIAAEAEKVARRLAREGAVGRFAVDFVVADGRHLAMEINLREGGTTHPHGALELLAGGSYDAGTGAWRTATGGERHYYATDAVVDPAFRSIDPRKLIARLRESGLEYHPESQTGIVLFMLRALPREGRIGLVAIAETPAEADQLQSEFRKLLLLL